jgi:cysteinyl-tRNA synthetase
MKKLDECDGKGKDVSKNLKNAKDKFEKCLNSDLEISGAMAAVFDLIKEINLVLPELSKKDAKEIKKQMIDFDSVLGFMVIDEEDVDENIQKLINEREKARKNKDFKKADEIRDELKKQGIVLEDTPKGIRWKRT